MSTQEQESRFGDKQFDASSANPGDVVWRDGTAPALIVGVNKSEDTEDVSVTIAPLTVETVHADDLATDNVDAPSGGATPTGIPAPVPPAGPAPAPVIAATQPPPDDPGRATTPTGAAVGTGAAGPADAGAAQAASEGSVQSTNPPPGGVVEPAPDESNIGLETLPVDQGTAREADQDARIAELEARLADAEARASSAATPPS